ncbi:MAG: cobalamin-binding protein [Acidobacteriota bacterium]|jgi:iron complex transport system substrate-binding protein|nr:cobalamin-binding protein [Acidobacteriota bacterium]
MRMGFRFTRINFTHRAHVKFTHGNVMAMSAPSLLVLCSLCILCVLCVLSGGGCARSRTDEPAQAADGRARTDADTVVYTDGTGRSVRIPRHPKRIISLAPNVTENIYLLGAEDRLIGNTTHCNWPEAAKHKPKIGDLLNPNYELILEAEPDLVISSTAGNDRAAVMKLTGLGVPVYVTAPRSLDEIFQTVEEIGRIIDCEPEAERLVAEMHGRLDAVKRKIADLQPLRGLFITWFDPLLTPGRPTFENDALTFAGVHSITAVSEEFYPRYSLEQVLAQDPDVILTIEHTGDPLPDFRKTPGWRELRAVKAGRVYFLSEYLQHPSPLFVDGVEDLAKKLYPERFQ